MAVLCEAISVIIKRKSIDEFFHGGWDKFLLSIQNPTFCTDGELIRIGFMSPDEVKHYVDWLIEEGLQWNFEDDRKQNDIAIVDQQRGLTMPCEWIEFSRLPMGKNGGSMAVCWLFEGERIGFGLHMPSKSLDISTPEGWEFETSLSHRFKFFETSTVSKSTH